MVGLLHISMATTQFPCIAVACSFVVKYMGETSRYQASCLSVHLSVSLSVCLLMFTRIGMFKCHPFNYWIVAILAPAFLFQFVLVGYFLVSCISCFGLITTPLTTNPSPL